MGMGELLTEGLRRTIRFLFAALLGAVIALLYLRFVASEVGETFPWTSILAVLCGGLAVGGALGLVGPALVGFARDSAFKLKVAALRGRVRRSLDKMIRSGQLGARTLERLSYLGTALLLKGENEKALAALEEAARQSPQDPVLLNNRAAALAACGHLPQALQGFHEALERGADECIAQGNIVLALASGAPPEEMAAACQKAWELIRERPDLLNILVVCLAEVGRREEALARLQSGLAEEPANPDFQINLGVLRFRQGDLEGACQAFISARIYEPVPKWGHHNAAVCRLLQGRTREAREFLSAVLREDPNFPPALGQLALLEQASNHPRRGVEILKEAARLAPADFEIRHNLCVLLLQAGKEEALTEAQRTAELRPNDHDALVNLSAAALLCRRHKTALEESQKAASLYPESALDALERYDEAIEQLEWLIKRYPKCAAAWANLGAVRLMSERTVDAANALIRASDLNPHNRDIRVNLALAHYLEGDPTAAVKELGAYAEKGDNSPTALDIRGHIHADKRPGDAIAAWSKLAVLEPRNTEVLSNLGIAYYRDDRSDAAVECFRKVLLHMPRSVIAHNNLALAYAKNKLLSEALHHISRVVEMQPDNPVVHSNAGLIQYFRGETERAMFHWREVTRLSPDYARRREATRLSTYDDSQMVVFPMNRRGRVHRYSPQFAPCHHEARFSVPPPRFAPLLPWPDLAETWALQERVAAAQRRLHGAGVR
jgi:tetratricopeptide (TPR) repeat protein